MNLFSVPLAIAVALAVLGPVAVSMAVALLAAAPKRSIVGPPPEGCGAGGLSIAGAGGVQLAAWFAEGRSDRAAVLLLHGLGADRRLLAERMSFLVEAGYSVLALDLRAHGESTGAGVTFGRDEAEDVGAALGWLRRACPNRKIAALGISLGGAALLPMRRAFGLDAMVLELVFPDMRRAIGNRVRVVFASLPFFGTLSLFGVGPASGGFGLAAAAPVVTPVFIRIAEWVTGLRVDDLRPIEALKSVTCPVMIVAGAADRLTTLSESRAMFEAAAGPKAWWAVEGAGHIDLCAFAGAAYRARILEFLQEALGSAEESAPRVAASCV